MAMVFFSWHLFQMDITPRTRSTTRHRRAPTPKLSERKKKLFDDNVTSINTKSPILMSPFQPYVRLERIIIEEADDSDIGPMSPLEFSSSPSSFNEVHRIIARDQKGNLFDCSGRMHGWELGEKEAASFSFDKETSKSEKNSFMENRVLNN